MKGHLILLLILPQVLFAQREKASYEQLMDSAYYYYTVNDFVKENTFYTRAIKLSPELPMAYYNKGTIAHRNKQYEEAISWFSQAIERKIESPLAFAQRAGCKRILGDTLGAIDDINQAISIDRSNSAFFSFRGEMRFYLGDTTAAFTDMNLALRFDSLDLPANAVKADILFHRNRMPEAFTHYQRVLRIDSTLAYAHSRIGVIQYEYFGDLDDAINCFSKAIAIDSTDVYYYQMRYVLYTETDSQLKALDDLNKIVELEPSALAYYERGRTKIRLKRLNKATLDFDKAIELDPNYAEAFYWRGLVKFQQGKDGCADLRKAVDMKYPDALEQWKDHCK